MTPLPGALGGTNLVAWRLEATKYLNSWATAEGAFQLGGRWNSQGRRVLYTSIDPATSILEVGVHKGFDVLDTVPHTLLEIEIPDPSQAYVVPLESIPNPNWLVPGSVSAGQQAFGNALLLQHGMLVLPSVVSTGSWNLLIDVDIAKAHFSLLSSKPFALDPRLHSVAQT